jgi:cobalt-zinc-cadmium efflux system protein
MGTTHDHSEEHSCADDRANDRPAHTHAPSGPGSKMGLAVAITLAFVAGEAIAGFFAHSLALMSDAGHNFADAAALGFSWYALWIARKPSHHRMTFGYHRVGILAAMLNAASLVVIALFIFWGGIERLRHPEAVNGTLMISVALGAIGVNALIGFWLHAGAAHDLNVRSAYLHMIGDAVSALGVVLAGVVVAFTGASVADPIVSFLIAGLILWSSWGVLKESVNVLMEGTPLDIDMKEVEGAIRGVARVLDCHDLHVWTVGPGAVACSVHVLVSEETIREGQQILRLVCERLRLDFKINHTTVQIEVEGHCPDELYCCIQPNAHSHVGHHH